MPTRLAPVAALLFALSGCPREARPPPLVDCTSVVHTRLGPVRGMEQGDSCAWRGLPFAKPPVGGLRWKAPQPPEPWQETRDATQWAARCMQSDSPLAGQIAADPSGRMSEDCLYLNVWRPRREGRYPVMVWIHGGAYAHGTANTPTFWGDRLAPGQGVVVVTIAYRLGNLGFLALPALEAESPEGMTGGYGTLDQIAALRWVRANIEAFGGDPTDVTIFGESAGGWSVCTLMASPLSRGLFERAIMQSGGCQMVSTLEAGFARGRELAAKLECPPDDLACLRAVTAERIVEASPSPTFTRITYGPHIDGDLLLEPPIETLRQGAGARGPLLAGTNRDELLLNAVSLPPLVGPLEAAYDSIVEQVLGLSAEDADALVALYPLSEFGDQPGRAIAQMVTDEAFTCPTLEAVEAVARSGGQAWLYRFDFDQLNLPAVSGAVHGAEIGLVFGTPDRPFSDTFFGEEQRAAAQPLAAAMQAAWASFAKRGAPRAKGLPEWPAYAPSDPRLMALDLESRVEPVRSRPRCAWWAEHDLELRF
ncbi:MAG: carboxylesterase/lipase family protein [Myxococcales bacterium]|jgi:para-nitrobenzyl esterase